ncbi:MAG: thrombospondin type 3 repeat-containing protein [Myxococcota bacterium]
MSRSFLVWLTVSAGFLVVIACVYVALRSQEPVPVGHDQDSSWWVDDAFWTRSQSRTRVPGGKSITSHSTRVAVSQPEFQRVTDGVAVNTDGFRASLTKAGIRFVGGDLGSESEFEWSLDGASIGALDLDVTSGWQTSGNVAQRRIGGEGTEVIEHMLATDFGIERSWVLSAQPASGGDFVVSTALSGVEVTSTNSDGSRLIDPDGHEYLITAPVLVDSEGTRLPMTAEDGGDRLDYRLTEERMASLTFPVAIDPVIQYPSLHSSLGGTVVRETKLSVSGDQGVFILRRDGDTQFDALIRFDATAGLDSHFVDSTTSLRLSAYSALVEGDTPGHFRFVDPGIVGSLPWDTLYWTTSEFVNPGGPGSPPLFSSTTLGPILAQSKYEAARLANGWVRINFKPGNAIDLSVFDTDTILGTNSVWADHYDGYWDVASNENRNEFAVSYASASAVPRVLFFRRVGQQVSLLSTVDFSSEPILPQDVTPPMVALTDDGRYLIMTKYSDTEIRVRWYSSEGQLEDAWSGLNAIVPGLAPLRLDFAAEKLVTDGTTFLLISAASSGDLLFSWLDQDGRPDGFPSAASTVSAVAGTNVAPGVAQVYGAEAIAPREYAIVTRDGASMFFHRVRFDRDADGDRLTDLLDNCPDATNADQLDSDSDSIGDACDSDIDGDGVNNGSDPCPYIAFETVCSGDADGDGVPDGDEHALARYDPNTRPGATELCDGKDNNGNGQIDEGTGCNQCD